MTDTAPAEKAKRYTGDLYMLGESEEKVPARATQDLTKFKTTLEQLWAKFEAGDTTAGVGFYTHPEAVSVLYSRFGTAAKALGIGLVFTTIEPSDPRWKASGYSHENPGFVRVVVGVRPRREYKARETAPVAEAPAKPAPAKK